MFLRRQFQAGMYKLIGVNTQRPKSAGETEGNSRQFHNMEMTQLERMTEREEGSKGRSTKGKEILELLEESQQKGGEMGEPYVGPWLI